jgi:hypothetical protein
VLNLGMLRVLSYFPAFGLELISFPFWVRHLNNNCMRQGTFFDGGVTWHIFVEPFWRVQITCSKSFSRFSNCSARRELPELLLSNWCTFFVMKYNTE